MKCIEQGAKTCKYMPADSRVPLRHRRETATQDVHRGIDDDDNASDCACSAASDCDYSIAPGESLGPNAGGAEKATDPASPDVIASPAPLSSRPFLDLHSCQVTLGIACQEAQPRHLLARRLSLGICMERLPLMTLLWFRFRRR